MSGAPGVGAGIAELLAPLRAEPGASAVLCDIDGTLAPDRDDPEDAAVPEATRSVLGELAAALRPGRVRVRPPRPSRLGAWSGSRRSSTPATTASSSCRRATRIPSWIRPWPTARAALGTSCSISMPRTSVRRELRLEDKGPIQALHWRGAVDQEAARERGGADRPPGRGRGPRAPLGAQGARAPPRRRHRQGHGGASACWARARSSAPCSAATTGAISTRSRH